MKFCAIICEFNPFHNGHKYLLERARELSGCDAIICIMSGSFTQRGDMCIIDKYIRAKHAVSGGADCVIELPSPFTVAPAEIFARGAIKIAAAIPEVTALAFGCENSGADFTEAAKYLSKEPEKFRSELRSRIKTGESYIKSYAEAFKACGGDSALLSNPNNILGVEYAKAALHCGREIKLLPVQRTGSAYSEEFLKDNYSSAGAIRNNLKSDKLAENVPDYVYKDLVSAKIRKEAYENLLRDCLFLSDTDTLKNIYGCGEGLENKLKSLENKPFGEIIGACVSKRYSSSRIRRIMCANMLRLYETDSARFLNSNLYLKPLAVRKKTADAVLSSLAKSASPVVTDAFGACLDKEAAECFAKDRYAYAVYNYINGADKERKGYDYTVLSD